MLDELHGRTLLEGARGTPPVDRSRIADLLRALSELVAMRPEIRGELGPLIDELHARFEQEIASAKQAGSLRCGICYLHFAIAEMDYREADGFYICQMCGQALRGRPLRMIRRQPRTGGRQ